KYFDIDWQPLHSNLRNKVLLPILGESYAQALEGGQIKLIFADSHFFVTYFKRKFPLALHSSEALRREAFDRMAPKGPTGLSAHLVEKDGVEFRNAIEGIVQAY